MRQIKYTLLTMALLLSLGACKDKDQGAMPEPTPKGQEQPKHIAVQSVSLSETEKGLSVGESFTLTTTVLPSDATNPKVTLHSDKEDVASVSPEGLVTAKSPGLAIITAISEGNKTATCRVRVTPVKISVSSISLDMEHKTINTGEEFTLSVSINPAEATEQAVRWTSDKPEIATVSAEGVVRGLTAGVATITATSVDGEKTATCRVTVNRLPVLVQGISLNHSNYTLREEQTLQLTATLTPDNADDKVITWSSDKEDIASVNASGLVTAHKPGRAVITARTSNNKSATCSIEVTARHIAVTSISLNKERHTMQVGEVFNLTATITPENASNKRFTWSSSQPTIARVENGRVTALTSGEARITVTTEDGQKTASCLITVSSNRVAVTSVSLSETFLTLSVNETASLTATVKPENATNKAVTWTSSDTRIATVNAQGVVTGKSAGTATITVRTNDGNHTESCTVDVNDDSDIPGLPIDPIFPDPSTDPPSNNGEAAVTLNFIKSSSKVRFEDGTHFEANSFIDLNNNGKKDADEGLFNNKDYTISGTSCRIYGGASSLKLSGTNIYKVSSTRLKTLILKHNDSESLELDCPDLQTFETEQGTVHVGNLKSLNLSKTPMLETLKVEYCKLEFVDFSKNRNIRTIYLRKNNIQETNAEAMFKTLPSVSNGSATIYFTNGSRDTSNKATKDAVAELKAKGWQIKRGNGSYADYDGV